MSRTNVLMLTVYVILIASIAGGLCFARSRVLGRPDTNVSQEAWQQWRQEAERQSAGQGPVTRRVPTATEAPTVLLLRDHFGACLTLTLMISTVLYATLAFMIRGVLFGPKLQLHHDAKQRPIA
ncbi:MAG TPA: hypothetical protein QF564_05690 [Pirellulaceae bacterium]|jgi:hypothetical protein|nr:hypothetical protein [Pirellulaceae bacterium]